jgi:hypothetical protein
MRLRDGLIDVDSPRRTHRLHDHGRIAADLGPAYRYLPSFARVMSLIHFHLLATYVAERGARWLVLVFVRHRHRDCAVTEGRARTHRSRDENRLGDFVVGASFFFCARDVRFDAPRALRNMGRRNRHQLFGLARNRAVLENFLVEFEKALELVRRILAQVAEILRSFLAVEICHLGTPGGDIGVATLKS